ncbi:uncharacterized protein J8A68_002474 [[Candida] subhashii]|uniref:Ketopantoate reductase C-terminal domain-containing protein n=1 Tax=[Candida] subhashii TaxID=561895 RepID=A0A8J5QKU1_9ASCO|nr:uncharacterized protein J8A68_002474 [[Candida] subhashii]KAG7663973.1 hypothetical protein J8A68_002474 [[Candida] subhashii]
MSAVQLLAIGTNANVAFYAWRFYQTKSVEVSIVNPDIVRTRPISWESKYLGNSHYTPHHIYNSTEEIPNNNTYDIIILSCPSLQDFQTTLVTITPLVDKDTIILVESTGYINLEPFIQMTLSNTAVMSLMNESDVRVTSSNKYSHQTRNNDTRIYFGTSLGSKTLTSNRNYQRVYKLLQDAQEDSKSSISLLKSLTPKEFMTYQWKLALPRIIFNPLMIIFESEFPEDLSNQILCKPLITGLINELLKLIKKMGCKLVKGFENEANLLSTWSKYYPKTDKNDKYINSPYLFYNYYHRYDLDLDLLLLQPILLGDDNGIRTPYLENLYSTMCQYSKINSGTSILFNRNIDSNSNGTSKKTQMLEDEIMSLSLKENELDTNVKNLAAIKSKLDSDILNHEKTLKDIEQIISQSEARLASLQYDYDKRAKLLQCQHEERVRNLEVQYHSKKQQHKHATSSSDSSSVSIPAQQPTPASDDSGLPPDTLADLAELAANVHYEPVSNRDVVATVENNEVFTDARSEDLPPHLLQKEMELQRREQALLLREQHPHQQAHPRHPSVSYQQQQLLPAQQPYHDASQPFQIPPNGYVHGHMQPRPATHGNFVPYGYPDQQQQQQQQIPHQIRTTGSMVALNQSYPGTQPQPQPPQPRRVGSMPQTHMAQPYQQPYHVSQSVYDTTSPVDGYAGIDPRFKPMPKKQLRKSTMGPLDGGFEGLDMGGRGGMPSSRKSLSAINTLNYQPGTHPQRKSLNNLNGMAVSAPPSAGGANRPITSFGESRKSSGSSNGKSSGGEMPEVPTYGSSDAKPLGTISQSNTAGGSAKKKKKGIFSR